MRKLFIILCSALALAACNKAVENSLSDEGNSAGRIVFRTAETTKSVTESTASVLQADGFKVAAVTGTTTFFNENVSYVSENAWFETAQTYYYPSANTNFFAVYPKTQAIAIDGTGAATLTYTSDGNTDLIAAKALDVVSRETPQPLTFDHILSQVVVKCQGSDANATYVVKSVTLLNTDAATYAYTTGAWTGANKTKASAIVSSNTAASTSSFTTMGEAVTAVPAEMDLRITWDCLQGSTVVGSYDETVTFTPTIGKICTVNCTLPNKDAKIIRFTISVNPWGSEEVNLTLEDPANGHDYVDLGLRVGGNKILFATMNIGASSETDYGDYFAWGETSKRYTSISGNSITGATFEWSNAPYHTGSNKYTGWSKYIPTGRESYSISGTADNLLTLEASDDVASVMWGGNWRMPDRTELEYLFGSSVDSEWVSDYNGSGVNGYKVTGKGEFSSSVLFFPAAGVCDGSTRVYVDFGRYWSRSFFSGPEYPDILTFSDGGRSSAGCDRYCGLSVRPVVVVPE